jgi:O-antigen/teichoic acid export membrane protein
MVGGIGLSKPILILFCGNDFINASLTMRILSIIVVVLSVSTFFNLKILLPVGKEKCTLITVLGGLVTNVGVDFFNSDI